jgi:hypothetical protein
MSRDSYSRYRRAASQVPVVILQTTSSGCGKEAMRREGIPTPSFVELVMLEGISNNLKSSKSISSVFSPGDVPMRLLL